MDKILTKWSPYDVDGYDLNTIEFCDFIGMVDSRFHHPLVKNRIVTQICMYLAL